MTLLALVAGTRIPFLPRKKMKMMNTDASNENYCVPNHDVAEVPSFLTYRAYNVNVSDKGNQRIIRHFTRLSSRPHAL